MASTKIVSGTGTGSVYLDALVWGGRIWDQRVPIKVWLGDPNELASAVEGRGGDTGLFGAIDPETGKPVLDAATLKSWTSTAEFAAFNYVLNLYESVCGLTFDRDGRDDLGNAYTIQDADMVWWRVDATDAGFVGLHENLATVDPGIDQVWGYFNYAATSSWSQLSFGGDGLNTIIHEIGHSLGLAHPHDGGDRDDATTFPDIPQGEDDNLGVNELNQSVFTVMSYNPGLNTVPGNLSYGTQGGLGAFDIAALQLLYGKNMSTAIGDDDYELFNQNAIGTGWMCIWDAGGDNDWIRGRNATGSVVIDLRAATLENGDPHAGGYISQQEGIAGGFTIAHGVVIENAEGGDFDDALIGNDAGNTLLGHDGSDFLLGLAGGDILDAGDGDDTLEGGEGADQLYGGDGFDLASYIQAKEGIVVNLSDWTQNTNDAQGDTYSQIEGVIGSNFNDTITGTDAAEYFSGEAGADVLTGGGGDDIYLVEGDIDQVIEQADGGHDTIITSRSVSLASFANCEDLYAASGRAAISLYGNAGSNTLVGNDGANLINGGAGNDSLQGGGGNDKLYGSSGRDTFVFNTRLSSKSNKDSIKDWSAKYDTIQLENAIFKVLKKTGILSKSFFVKGAKALDGNDYIGYNGKTGDLWYDPNGDKAGGQVMFANIGKNKMIAYNDFIVI